MADAARFTVIGENVHCSRRIRLDGKRCLKEGGKEFVVWKEKGRERRMEIAEWFKKDNQHYASGNVSHCMLATQYGLRGETIGAEYIQWVARRQVEKGAHYLDVNIDEVSASLETRLAAMKWIVPVAQAAAGKAPLSIDSSNLETLKAGLAACDPARGLPMLNSIALERLETLDLAAERKLPAIVMASNEQGMPRSVAERLANIERLVGLCTQKALPLGCLYIDVLIYPLSANPAHGKDALDTMKAVRAKYGPEIHIAGGHSNFSYGLPLRQLLNAVWLDLAIERGCDSGIIDPLSVDPQVVRKLDRSAEYYKRTREMIESADEELMMQFLEDAREGTLKAPEF
jgi:cobalamin-dependent methionine synthase I